MTIGVSVMTRWLTVALLLLSLSVNATEADGEWFGDIRLRYDDVSRLPGSRPDFDRGRLHAWLGYRWFFSDGLEFGIAARLAASTDSNSDNVANLDNQESSEFDLGELYLRWEPNADSVLQVGQARLPIRLSGAVWDQDFRPIGASYLRDVNVGQFNRLTFTGGYFGAIHIDESDSRLAAAQLEWQWRDGAPSGYGVMLSYLDFSDLDGLVSDRRTRTAPTMAGRLVNDYQLMNLQFEARWPIAGGLVTELDLIRNLGADQDNEAARFSIIAGNAFNAGEWEFGYTYQRIQRNAIMPAFNEDDWWFPSATRGYSPWVAYGITDAWRLRLAGFFERRDDRPETLRRYLVDLNWQW